MEQTGFTIEVDNNYNDYIILKAIKTEALALIGYQTELMSLYSKKYSGKYEDGQRKVFFDYRE
ncbi:hypothetical protein [Amphibacillus sediminis]|uniref:hypothetical protein n=1 Tax=Amphibacillus sediminis TaxID=360185 RepID=UPI000835103D|nr:hypothetical protein [Amphibacillus sediminis]